MTELVAEREKRIDMRMYESMKLYEVWIEGYMATGQCKKAEYLGEYRASSFKEACKKAVIYRDMGIGYYDEERNTYWGCRFFDNYIDARKGFG